MKTKEKISLFVYATVLLLVAIYQMVFQLTIFETPDLLEPAICYTVTILTILFIVLNIKNIEFKDYLLFILVYFLIATIQTYNTNTSIFYDKFPNILLSCSTVIICILPLKDNNSHRIKIIDYTEFFMLFVVLIVNVLSIHLFFIEGNHAGITLGQNTLGAYNSAVFVIAVGYFIKNKKPVVRILSALLIIISSVYVLMTTSRASLLVLLAYMGLLALYFVIHYFKQYKKIFIVLFIAFAAFCIIFREPILDRLFKGAVNSGDFLRNALTGRYEIWFNAFPATMKGHWLFGNGIYTIRDRTIESMAYLENTDGIHFSLFHCSILDITFSAGLVGVVFMMLFIISLIKTMRKKSRTLSELLSIFIIIGFICAGLFDINFIWDKVTYNYLMIFMEISRLLILRKEVNNENK